MKTKKLLLLWAFAIAQCALAQAPASSSLSTISAAEQADEQKAREFFVQHNFNPKDYDEYITSWRKEYTNFSQNKQIALPASTMAACTNIDFEQGSLNGWTPSTGFHPLFNPIGCCPTAGGSQTITSGTGLDPFGLFPVVCPGGNYSLQLGDALTGGHADRIEQKFLVTSANSNYSYKYAVVLEDPGHPVSQQPGFTAEMLDSNGTQIPCTYYDVAAGQGIPGFQSSTVQADVVFKPWTTVAVNLTAYIGQNVTIRFTTYDCALGGHFGYAYVDGSCQSFQIIQNSTLCSNSTTQLCAPAGFGAYSWMGPGVVSGGATSCATINAGGMYNVLLTTVTGCSSPISFSVTSVQAPTASFTTNNLTCNPQASYTNTSVGTGLTSFWNFGDGATSTSNSPTHTYTGAGTYTNTLIVYSTNSCSDTTKQIVTVFPKPNAQFIFTQACATNVVVFSNNSAVSGGTITNSRWAFGDGGTSLVVNPTHIYSTGGNYNVQLTVTDNNLCKDSLVKITAIYNLPVASFNAQAVCQGSNTVFNNTSTVTGSTLSGYTWDFTSDGIIDNTAQNPSTIYPASGTYSVTLQVTSAQGCVSAITNTVVVNSNPTVLFAVTNACTGSNFAFANNSTVANGNITQSSWNFGDGTNSTQTTAQHIYSPAGTYSVTLTETSNQGCVSIASKTVTAYPKPVVNFTANAVCQLQANAFTNLSTVASGSIAAWGWDFTSDGTIDNNTQNPSYTYSQGGIFNCTLHATTDMGCEDFVTKPVTVYLNPMANFTSPGVCNGSAMQFTDVSTSQNGTVTGWAWDYTSNGTFDSNTQNASTIYPTYGTYSVTLQVTTSLGCLSSTTHTVAVNPNPTVAFLVNNACAGSNFIFANNSTIAANGNLVQNLWNFGDGTTSTQVAPQHSYAAANTYNITLTETSNFGCVSSISQPVTAYPKPNVSFTANSVCQAQASTFNNTSSIVSGSITSYGWDFTSNGSIDDNNQSTSYTYTQGGSFNCTLHATSDKGCVDSAKKVVTVYFNPKANFSAPTTCNGTDVQFTDASTSQNGNITVWDWDFTSDGTIDNLYQNPTNAYANAGLFLVTLQVQTNYGCINVIKKSVRINATPVADLAVTHQAGCPNNMCVGMVNNSTIQGGIISHWLWNFGDGTTSTQNSPTHCFKTGMYNVSLTATSDSGCISSFTLANAITVWPKPVAGFDYTPKDVDILDPTVSIINEAQGATSYLYFISDGYVVAGHPNFTHTFPSENPQNYTAMQVVTNSYGCRDSIEHNIIINPGYTFYIPNAFTPNSDGKNETFKGIGIGIKTYTLMIFDRWGELIFQSDDLEKGWDGTFKGKGGEVVQEGVYVWKVLLRDERNKEHDFNGTVSVIK
jgi:gliding motility-associated-like protein